MIAEETQLAQYTSYKFSRQWGYIDSTGTLMIPPLFDEAFDFREGLGLVKVRGLWGYVDASGNLVIPPTVDNAQSFSEGLAAVKSDAFWGLIDQSGTYAIPPSRIVPQTAVILGRGNGLQNEVYRSRPGAANRDLADRPADPERDKRADALRRADRADRCVHRGVRFQRSDPQCLFNRVSIRDR